MAVLADYEELLLDGINVDSLQWRASILRANYGEGYGDKAVVGSVNGNHRWVLDPSPWLDDPADGNLINGLPGMQYYFDFFKRHTAGTKDVFKIEWRGRKYLASFEESGLDIEVFTKTIFQGGLTVRQRRVKGFYEGTDGSVFEPSLITGLWGWYKAESFDAGFNDGDPLIDVNWTDLSGFGHDIGITIGANFETNEQNGLPTVRLNGTTGFFKTTLDPVIYEAIIVLKVREATFSTFQGILTADATTAALIGNNGDTKLVNLGFGGTYQYRKNGVILTEATQNAPMNAHGVIHGRWSNGITLANLQIGKDRADGTRMLKGDLDEIILCDQYQSTEVANDIDGYCIYRWGIV